MRSRYDIQTINKELNLSWDYMFYSIDGEKTLAELCIGYGLHWELVYEVFNKLQKDGYISINTGEETQQPITE